MSPSPRKAWIETTAVILFGGSVTGRLPPGRRGLKHPTGNLQRLRHVAFPPEGVDCNGVLPARRQHAMTSPSPRKAWIETLYTDSARSASASRLPPGRRGLKRALACLLSYRSSSPSPRKAWIETVRLPVTLMVVGCRLPPGRRGLKLNPFVGVLALAMSPSPRKAWIETA